MRYSSILAAACSFLLCVGTSVDALAGNINVTNLKDSGGGSLRDAIDKANKQKPDPKKGAPVIQFAKNLSGTINLTSGALVITGDVIINGPGANNLTVQNTTANTSVFRVTFGNVNLSGLTISGGNTTSGGGGINNSGALTLSDAMVVGNSGGGGAGILNAPGGTVEIMDSTVANNNSTGLGGAIHNSGTLTLVNSTISDNSATSGGGIYNDFGSTVSLNNVTVAFNNASANGGGIYNEAAVSTLIGNTIVSNDSAAVGPDIFAADLNGAPGAPISNDEGNNLIGNTTGASGYSGSGDQLNANPNLGSLTQNGGTTTTRALLPPSPAIDAGNPSLAVDPSGALLGFDQRGAGFPRISGATVDIGAFEVQVPTAPQTARQWKTDAVNLLSSSIPTGDPATDKQFNDAIKKITQSLDPKLWVDDSHLVGDGNAVFDSEEGAAHSLADPHVQSASSTIAQQATSELVTADSLLATTEYNSAIAGNPSELAKAQQSMQAAQSATGEAAIEDYEQAFQHSYRALGH